MHSCFISVSIFTTLFLKGHCSPSKKPGHICQRQKRYGFSLTACDQVMEQAFNRDSKTKGGITGFTLNRSAVQRWILSQSERGPITRECHSLAGLAKADRLVISI